MTLACVEALCKEYQIPYHKEEAGISFSLYSHYKTLKHPVFVSPYDKSGLMQALLWFPEPETQNIEEVERLCGALNETFSPYVRVGFKPECGRFWVMSLFSDEDVGDKLSALAHSCDILSPLIERVGCLGRWDGGLIQLACTDPQDCGHA